MQRLTPAEGLATVGLLAALVYLTLHTVAGAGWGEPVELAPWLGLYAVLIGLLAAKSLLRSIVAFPVATILGLQAVLVTHALASPVAGWTEKLEWLSNALLKWTSVAAVSGATHDPLVFGIIVGQVGYLLGFCSAWLVFRLQAGWPALVLNGAAGLLHLSYATVESVPPFVTSLLVGVLMIASLELHLRRDAWMAIGVPVQGYSTLWTLTSAGCLALVSLLVALQLPAGDIHTGIASYYRSLTEPWTETQRQIDRLFGGGKGQARPGVGLAFSKSLVPRDYFELGESPVLEIVSPRRSYWRTSTYDRYDGRSMGSTEARERSYTATIALPADPQGLRQRTLVEQEVTILADSATALFFAEAPVSFSLSVLTGERQEPWDLAAVRSTSPLRRGERYTVTSAVPVAGRSDIASAQAPYPPWVDRYLELPATLPLRIGELGNRLSTPHRTQLERTIAVEEHLRGLRYSTRPPVPPAERDWVDYLLFESGEGYCDYLATAMVVLLRTQGIPARVASGFAPGTFDEQARAWIVRESDAHSWVEVYFTDFGWIVFEPSAIRQQPARIDARASESARVREGAASGVDELGPLDEIPPEFGGLVAQQPQPTLIGNGLLLLGAVILAIGGVYAALGIAWERGLRGEPLPRRRYGHLRRWIDWGGWRLPSSATPFEASRAIGEAVPAVRADIDRLTRHYVESTYGRAASPEADHEAESAWQAIKGPLTLAALRRLLYRRTSPSDNPSGGECP